MTSAGRQLLEAGPVEWVEIHRSQWPSERHAFQDAVGRVLSAALSGKLGLLLTPVEEQGPWRIELEAMGSSDRACLDLEIPDVDEDGRSASRSVDIQATMLPFGVGVDSTWVMSQLPNPCWVELSNLDAVVSELLLAPIMADLAAVLRLRAGRGPQTDKGRADRLSRCREVHEALGLQPELIRPLLDPTIRREVVIEAREALLRSWAVHPIDLGERAMALLCARLAKAYYAKARKDGTIEEARVITAANRPLLEATLRDWNGLVSYLGEDLSPVDAQPVPVPDVVLPDQAPVAITERLATLRDWWGLYDARQAAQRPGDTSLEGLIPPRWNYAEPDNDENVRPANDLYRTALPAELVERIEGLWGTDILTRHPATLVTEPHPLIRFGQLLRPAIDVWDGLAMACWSLCFGPYARYPLDQLQEVQEHVRRELEKLGAPVDVTVYEQLCHAGSGYDWLFEPRGPVLNIVVSLSGTGEVTATSHADEPAPTEAEPAFITLRAIVDDHRHRWLDGHLDRLLDAMWRADVDTAASAYWRRFRGRGAAPTIKQALPDVLETAKRWFGGDYGALARLVGLQGPVCQSPLPTNRRLPGDLPGLHREIARILSDSARASELDPQQISYRLNQLSTRSDDILAYWQAAGSAPARSSIFGAGYAWVFRQVFACEIDDGYNLVLSATREALARRGHPAALELEMT